MVSGVGATHGAIACVAQNAVVPRLEDQVPDSFLVEWRPQLLQRLAGLRLSSAIEIRQDDHQRPVNRLLYWFCIGRFFSQNPHPVAFFPTSSRCFPPLSVPPFTRAPIAAAPF